MKIVDRISKVSPELLEEYRKVAPATLGHLNGLRFMSSAIKPVYGRCKMIGTAVTVRAPGGIDAEILNRVTEMVKPGDVVVVDRCGDTEHAVIGEFRAARYVKLGAAGWVVDGAVCDIVAIEEMGFPVFSRTVSALVAKGVGLQGEINTPVNCGGVVVHPGDLIIGDDDGVVVLSAEEAEALLPTALQKEAQETEMRLQYGDILHRNRRG